MNNKYTVYVLHSSRDGGVIVGHTDDLPMELARHEAGQIRETKYRLPVQLIHKENVRSFKQVKMRQQYWEGPKGRKEIERWIGPLPKRARKE